MRLLSVGSGKEQVDVIKKAKIKGHYVIAIDGNEQAEGFKYADENKVIDISKKDNVIEYAKEKKIEGVLQVPIGKLLNTIGAVNDALGLIGISEEAANSCTDKYLTNRILSKNKISCAKQVLIENPNKDKIINELKNINIPCVIKPRDGSGSNGVRIICSIYEIEKMVTEHLIENNHGDTLVEEFLQGKEYGVDFIVVNGKGYLVLVREKRMTDIPFRQEIGYVCPAILSEEIYNEIYNTMNKAIQSLKINNTLVNADIMINNGKVSIVEISGRAGGLFISTKIIPLATEIDFIEKGIEIVTNNFNGIKNNKFTNYVVIKFWNLQEGIVKKLPSDDIFKDEVISEYILNVKVGDEISKVKKGKDLIHRGYIILKSNSLDEITKKIKYIEDQFIIQEEIYQ